MDVKFIISKLLFSLNEQQDIDIVDKYHIYQKFDDFSKISIDYDLLEKESIQYQINNSSMLSKVPKELLFTPKQIYNMIINEIKSFNKNTNFKHYIERLRLQGSSLYKETNIPLKVSQFMLNAANSTCQIGI